MFAQRLAVNLNRFSVARTRLALYSRTAAEEQKLFWQKNAKLNRPMSPHLTIYRLPQNANLSILHRITGATLAATLFGFGLGSFLWTGKFESVYEYLRDNIHPHVILTAKVALAFPFVYHTLNGVRHLIWDSGRALQLPVIYKTGYAVVAISILAALALATQ